MFLRVTPAARGAPSVDRRAGADSADARARACRRPHRRATRRRCSRRWTRPAKATELAIALAGIFSRRDGLQHRAAAGRPLRAGVRAVHARGRRRHLRRRSRRAEFRNDGRVLRAIRFTPPGGKPGYYDEQGRSLRRFFLRSPLKFEPRITSRYSLQPDASRAAHGARASRRGLRRAGRRAGRGGRGRHRGVGDLRRRPTAAWCACGMPAGYESRYLHLSAFAAGIRAGVRVEQGETIGLVGSSGLATGPHLHYGLQQERRVREPARRAAQHAAGRAASRRRDGALRRRRAIEALVAARRSRSPGPTRTRPGRARLRQPIISAIAMAVTVSVSRAAPDA